MRTFLKIAVVAAVVAAVVVVVKKLLEQRSAPVSLPSYQAAGPQAIPTTIDESELGGPVSQELLDILVCPLDKGSLRLSADGKWLVNPRNGYRYPIRRGIPVMLIEEGRKYQDESLIEVSPEPFTA